MKKKKAGFTLLEMILVIMLTTIVVCVMGSIMFAGHRVFSDTDVKSDLQIEGQSTHEKISNICMQASDIQEVKLSSGQVIDVKNASDTEKEDFYNIGWTPIQEIVLNVVGIDTNNNNNNGKSETPPIQYTFRLQGKELVMIKSNDSSGSILSRNVKDFKINPSSTGVDFEINLMEKKGFATKEYPIKVGVLFRNKDITEDTASNT